MLRIRRQVEAPTGHLDEAFLAWENRERPNSPRLASAEFQENRWVLPFPVFADYDEFKDQMSLRTRSRLSNQIESVAVSPSNASRRSGNQFAGDVGARRFLAGLGKWA